MYYTSQCPFNAKYVPVLEQTAEEKRICQRKMIRRCLDRDRISINIWKGEIERDIQSALYVCVRINDSYIIYKNAESAKNYNNAIDLI